ncbi:MAG: tRNA lysidine(34) synthetase TilS [Burkholderiaceae bacterium]|jgi:tRNA(Ile)-lysidine synthase|nr:tRNA lysidine(34) synthetase TilS [Burkholderiaceae bacterium]
MNALEQAIAAFSPGLPLAVALSGGADSSALLLACARRWPGQVQALHVHHGLQAAADTFERHCVDLCARLSIPLHARRVDARHASGESPEAAARRARYAALAALAREQGIADIALAHQADDQAETLLIALARGAGLAGLAAMPALALRGGLRYHRPLLALTGADLRLWLRAQGIAWTEDPSNSDMRFTRNRIRAGLLPAVQTLFPHFRTTFARSAAHAAQAQELLEQLAAQDLQSTGQPPRIVALQALARARQANALRHWLATQHGCRPSAAQLEELLDQIACCTTRGHRIHLKLGGGFIKRQGTLLQWSVNN